MRKSAFLFLSIPLFGVLLPVDVYCDPVLEVRLQNEVVELGSSTRLDLEITWPKDEGIYKFALPQLPLPSASIKRVGESQETYVKEDKTTWIKKNFQIEIQPKNPGEISVNSFLIPYVKGDDITGAGGSLQVPALTIKVKEKSHYIAYYAVITLLIFVVLGFVTIFLYRRKTQVLATEEAISEEDMAIERIQNALSELKENNVKDVLKNIANEFSSFLCGRYKAEPMKLNEKELLAHLKEKELPIQERQRIEAIFEDIHRARYAGLGDGQRDARVIAGEMTAYINSKRILGTPS